MPLQKRALPFDDPNFVFELKYDGFRALAVIDRRPELVSRNSHPFASYAELAKQIAAHLPVNTVLDGEIVAVDRKGKPRFNDLLFHRGPPCFFAFDLLTCEGRDWRTHQSASRNFGGCWRMCQSNVQFGTSIMLMGLGSRYLSGSAKWIWRGSSRSTSTHRTPKRKSCLSEIVRNLYRAGIPALRPARNKQRAARREKPEPRSHFRRTCD
jgi:hypothetical protein